MMEEIYWCFYLMGVRLTGAGSVSTTTGMAKLKKQFLKDSNPYPPTTLINSSATCIIKNNNYAVTIQPNFNLRKILNSDARHEG